MVEFGGESSGRFRIAGWGMEKRVCLLCGRECAVEADIGVEGGVRVREAVYRASQVLARVGFLYLRFLTIQLQQAHPPTVDAHELHRVALTRHLNEILRGVAF